MLNMIAQDLNVSSQGGQSNGYAPKELAVTLKKLSCMLIWIGVKYCKALINFLDLFILMF